MYDTSFVCTYHLIDDSESSDDLYKLQFLQAFGLEDWDDDTIGKELDLLYSEMQTSLASFVNEKLQQNEQFKQLAGLSGCSEETAFCFIFGYDTFYLAHKCVCEMRRNGNISDEARDALLNKL